MPEDSPILATIAAAERENLSPAELERRVWDRHGTTCAMLALDSSGMTRISRREGIVHFLARYLRARDLAATILTAAGCVRWRCFADNLFAEFPEPDVALRAALGIHRQLRESRVMLTDTEPYRVCIGIGYGHVLDDGPFGVMGNEMNVVAKLAEDIAEAGETLLTDAAYQRVGDKAAVRFERLGRMISQVEVTYHRASG